jgi:hypothetical protein
VLWIAAAQLRKLNAGFTVETWASIHWSDGPTFNVQYQRIVEGLRNAACPRARRRRIEPPAFYILRIASLRSQ